MSHEVDNSSLSRSELRKLPSVTTLADDAARARVFDGDGEAQRLALARAVLAEARAAVLAGAPCPSRLELVERLRQARRQRADHLIRRVLNATGIPLHTNLGRAPLPRSVLERVVDLTAGYASVELDLAAGQRGDRDGGTRELLRVITGAEDATVVNNGAAAVLLALAALAPGKEVIVSRGELVQIGGGFRVPDILAASGAVLKEVGTTNITTLADYERALSERTGLLLRVHRSNFHLSGHTEEPPLEALAALARSAGVPLVHDLGSGAFRRWRGHDPQAEPTVSEVLRAGVDLATFSGDKLVGGPQAGLVVGRAALVRRLARHPLYRALRPGRLTLVTLQEVLRFYAEGRADELPAWAMIEADDVGLAARARSFAARLVGAGLPALVEMDVAAVGGGSAPAAELPGPVIVLRPKQTEAFLARLRAGDPAVVPRVERQRVLLDLRTVAADDETELLAALVDSWTQ